MAAGDPGSLRSLKGRVHRWTQTRGCGELLAEDGQRDGDPAQQIQAFEHDPANRLGRALEVRALALAHHLQASVLQQTSGDVSDHKGPVLEGGVGLCLIFPVSIEKKRTG